MMRRWLVASLALALLGAAPRTVERSFNSAGVRIHYLELGQGEPVVLLHGLTVNGRLNWFFPGIAQDLARDHRVIVMDLRGHGLSGKPHDPAQYGPQLAEDVVRLLDHLGIKKAHVVGYSLGGFVTLRLLATHADRLLSATTGGAGLPHDHEDAFLNRLANGFAEGHGMGPLLRRLTGPNRYPPNDSQIRIADRLNSLVNDPLALAAVVRSLPALAVPEGSLAHNGVPVLALAGEFDPLKAGVEEMRGHVGCLRLTVIKGRDHMDAFQDPQFLRNVREFLTSHESTAKQKAAESVDCCGSPR